MLRLVLAILSVAVFGTLSVAVAVLNGPPALTVLCLIVAVTAVVDAAVVARRRRRGDTG